MASRQIHDTDDPYAFGAQVPGCWQVAAPTLALRLPWFRLGTSICGDSGGHFRLYSRLGSCSSVHGAAAAAWLFHCWLGLSLNWPLHFMLFGPASLAAGRRWLQPWLCDSLGLGLAFHFSANVRHIFTLCRLSSCRSAHDAAAAAAAWLLHFWLGLSICLAGRRWPLHRHALGPGAR